MGKGILKTICIAPQAGAPMQSLDEVLAVAGQGLQGDRYCTGEGSFNKGKSGKRQVTVINHHFVESSSFGPTDTRRNLVIDGVELMWLLGKGHEFTIGDAVFRAVGYCDPCQRPTNLSEGRIIESFRDEFFDRGGIIVEVVRGGIIRVGDDVITPSKGY